MYLLAFYFDNLCFKWRFEQGAVTEKKLSKIGKILCPHGKTGRSKTKQEIISWVRRVCRSVLDYELKLYLLIWTLNIISRDANFQKSNTSEMLYQIFPHFSLTDNRCFPELSSEEEC